MVDAATEGEEELQAQLAADPTLPATWAALLADEAEVACSAVAVLPACSHNDRADYHIHN